MTATSTVSVTLLRVMAPTGLSWLAEKTIYPLKAKSNRCICIQVKYICK